MTEATNAREHEWLFRLIQSGSRTDWWLELKTLEELAMSLDATDGRYGRAFSNYLNDSDYGPAVGHGKYAAEAPLTFLAYLRGLNRNQSIVESLVGAKMEAAANMASAIVDHGKLYVNPVGGWNWGAGIGEFVGFLRTKTLSWPSFTERDIRISRFPGGKHWYAYVGQAQVRDGDKLKFDTREAAMRQAELYLTGNI